MSGRNRQTDGDGRNKLYRPKRRNAEKRRERRKSFAFSHSSPFRWSVVWGSLLNLPRGYWWWLLAWGLNKLSWIWKIFKLIREIIYFIFFLMKKLFCSFLSIVLNSVFLSRMEQQFALVERCMVPFHHHVNSCICKTALRKKKVRLGVGREQPPTFSSHLNFSILTHRIAGKK